MVISQRRTSQAGLSAGGIAARATRYSCAQASSCAGFMLPDQVQSGPRATSPPSRIAGGALERPPGPGLGVALR
ncbi:MAG: hypothetical protein ACK559_16865, partial [bacterium]